MRDVIAFFQAREAEQALRHATKEEVLRRAEALRRVVEEEALRRAAERKLQLNQLATASPSHVPDLCYTGSCAAATGSRGTPKADWFRADGAVEVFAGFHWALSMDDVTQQIWDAVRTVEPPSESDPSAVHPFLRTLFGVVQRCLRNRGIPCLQAFHEHHQLDVIEGDADAAPDWSLTPAGEQYPCSTNRSWQRSR